jgi:hypothetical protein
MFKEEIDYYNKCIKPNNKLIDIEIKDSTKELSQPTCPAKCDFTECLYKCTDSILNSKYYDPKRNIYKKLTKSQLDYSTFTANLAPQAATTYIW